MSPDADFARLLLKETMKLVKEFCKEEGIDFKDLKKNAWGYRGLTASAFHIEACSAEPTHFHHYQQKCLVTQVKADGWAAWLYMKQQEKEEHDG